jgi:hypothetical protein
MKPVVVFVLTFVVAAGASTGAKVAMTKPAPHAADSARVDSTAADSAGHADSTTHGDSASRADSTKSAVDTAVAASGLPVKAPSDTTPVSAATAASKTAPKATAATATVDTVTEASERRLAKVFSSMDVKQAAKVLEHMTDNDVKVILGYVGVKQAAAILAALPPERGAALSKLSMGKK